MFIRPCHRTKNGKRHAYWALVESFRTDRGPRQRTATDDNSSGSSATVPFDPGRYFLGSQTAPVLVTVVSDYQCPSCRQIDAQLRAMTAGRDDVSITMRHFPFCTDCNKHIDKTRHANACYAARAAEAAGILGGSEAFWRMHHWLFEHRGEFFDTMLREMTTELGFDHTQFVEVMQGDETLAAIQADAKAADQAGLRFTPMIFINGVPIDMGNKRSSAQE